MRRTLRTQPRQRAARSPRSTASRTRRHAGDLKSVPVGGGLVITVSAIDLSDILSDSGIQEAGDVATRAVRQSSWKSSKFLRKWNDAGLCDELAVNDGKEGGPEAVLDITSIGADDGYFQWKVNLTGSMWLEICRLAVG